MEGAQCRELSRLALERTRGSLRVVRQRRERGAAADANARVRVVRVRKLEQYSQGRNAARFCRAHEQRALGAFGVNPRDQRDHDVATGALRGNGQRARALLPVENG